MPRHDPPHSETLDDTARDYALQIMRPDVPSLAMVALAKVTGYMPDADARTWHIVLREEIDDCQSARQALWHSM